VGLAAAGREEGVVVLAGTVTTTLVAVAEVRGADGGPIGLATAQTAVRVQRNIRNEYLEDFDRLVGDDPSAEVRYRDAFEPAPPPFSSAPAGVPVLEATLAAPEGRILASVRLLSLPREKAAYTLALSYRRGVAALAAAGVLSWMLGPTPRRMGWRLRLALGATALRILALFVAVKLSPAASSLLSSDAYASTLVGPLSRSPIDLLLTAAWAFVLAGLLLERALVLGPSRPSPARALGAAALAFPLLGGVFGWIADTSANCPLDLETITVLPRSAAHLAMQVSLLAILGTGLLLVAGLLALGGPWPRGGAARALRAASWVALGLLAYRLWPRELIGIPLLPAIGLFMLAAALAGTHRSWHPWIVAAPAGAQAGWALAGVATLSLLLHPTLVHFAEKEARQQIELSHAPLILRQPQWREHNLEQARKRIDEIAPLEQAAGAVRPGVEELAFSVWAATDLATFGFSSALEIQDPSGAVISRFGLNMPSLSVSGPPRPLPAHDTWRVSRERLRLASAERPVLHARRRLSHDGEVRGAVHLYIGEDFWNLPFIPARDPYSVLYRTAGRRGGRGQPAALLVYDAARAKVFSSADRPPALRADLAHRLRAERGLWTTLPIDGRPHHTFLFTDGQSTFGLGFPRVGAGRFVADLVEAMASMTLVALLVLLALMASRTALRRPSLSLPSLGSAVRRRFALRVFVAFVTVALVPVAVLEIVVLRFVADRLHRESEDQGLEKAAVAQKAVEDFAYFQRGEAPGGEPVTDAALVWVSSLIRNDLDVFSRGRILASSKRELYASGLLPARVSGAVFRSLILDQAPSVLRTETIGGFSTLVASVPVRLQGVEPGILSIPLTLRQREVQATLEDLDRANRLASVGFLLLAALLSHSMARRISDPIRDLTRATRRVAAGDLEARVLTEARDELRELVESFNQMARDLDTQRTDLERSNRLAAWADMARQVAHEVKNPLTPIQLSAEHLRRVFRDGGPDFDATLEACTGNILRQVETLRRIVTEFSAFARPPARDLTLTDPATLVTEAIAPYATGLPAGVRLSVEAPAGLPAARLDRRLVERAVLNLVENALQAVGERGTIAVRVQAHDGRVEIEVEDSGPGVDPDIRERMFEPFFSTKTGGSGLGLALVKKIAEDHGGGASLASGPGEGTRVQIWFPAARGAAALSDGEKPGGAT
jgi:signal transduction histidine kinase